jgi:hypothetical protein
MRSIDDFTDEELAEYQLRWISMLAYDDQPLAGVELEAVIDALEEGARKDDVVLMLHEIEDMYEEEDLDLEEWSKRHPIRYLLARLGWHLQERYGRRA